METLICLAYTRSRDVALQAFKSFKLLLKQLLNMIRIATESNTHSTYWEVLRRNLLVCSLQR